MTSTDSNPSVLAERYQLEEKLGQGAQGITWRAYDRQSDQWVALKKLAMHGVADWKAVELFEREAKVLEALDHPAIPRYIDAFSDDKDGTLDLYLVQTYVEGTPLDRAIEEGLRLTEKEAIDFVRRLLHICTYIHGLDSPVIHRDIKPSNIVRRPDASLSLIDFGAVQTLIPDQAGGSTVVGTTGYMPLEQLMGRAQPATDLYALGATTLHLLCHIHPAQMPVVEMKLQFREHIAVSADFADLLERLVEPHLEDRFASAQQALDALDHLEAGSASPGRATPPKSSHKPAPLTHAPDRGGAVFNSTAGRALAELAHTNQQVASRAQQKRMEWAADFAQGASYERPAGSIWEEHREDGRLILRRPPWGIYGAFNELFFATFWGAFLVVFASIMLFADPANVEGNPIFGWMMLSLFAVAWLFLMYAGVKKALSKEEIHLDSQGLRHQTSILNRKEERILSLEAAREVDIGYFTRSSKSGTRITYYIFVANENWRLGEGLDKPDLLWLATAIRDAAREHLDQVVLEIPDDSLEEKVARAEASEKASW